VPKGGDDKDAELRVVEEETFSEEILRLGEGKAEEVARIEVAPPVESPMRLPTEESDADRRTHEPDIDVIIEDARESEDLEDDWQEAARRGPVPYGWFVLIFLGIIGALGWSAGWFGDDNAAAVSEQARTGSVVRLEEEDQEIREATQLVEMVEAKVRQYAGAKSMEDLLPFIRQRERVEPLMRQWYENHAFEEKPFGRLILFQPLELDARNFFIVRYEVKGTNEPADLLVEDQGDLGIFVDWETDVCYQPVPWGRYVDERPAGSEDFRVRLVPDYGGLYSHEFQNEEKWRAMRLTVKGSDEFLIGYVERRSPLEESLLAMLEDNRYRPVSVVLKLRVPEDVQSLRGVVIEELVSKRWLVQTSE